MATPVSPAFGARTGSGACSAPGCGVSFTPGERAAFYAARLTPDGGPGADLARGERHSRRTGRTARGRATYETREGYWERMVHLTCANRLGWRLPNGETIAQRGSRTIGHGDTGSVTPTPAAAPAAPVTPAVVAPTYTGLEAPLAALAVETASVRDAQSTGPRPAPYFGSDALAARAERAERAARIAARNRAPLVPVSVASVAAADDVERFRLVVNEVDGVAVGSVVNEVPEERVMPLELD